MGRLIGYGVVCMIVIGVFRILAAPAFANYVPASTQPDARQLWAMVLANRDVRLAEGKHVGCTNETGRTVGEYVSFLLGTLSHAKKDEPVRIQARCLLPSEQSPLPPTKGANEWNCALEAFTSDKAGESPWSYGFHFRVRAGKLDKKYMACPGT